VPDSDAVKVILVFGREGQVARELADRPPAPGTRLEFLGRAQFDLLGGGDIAAVIARDGVAGVINASAHTAVDRAESEAPLAFRLNRDAPAEMARACAGLGIPFVHFSTDYVFDGEKTTGYVEDDPRHPLGVYGASKAEGEDAVAAAGGRYAILRTAWVYSAFGANFLKTMLRLAQTRDEVGVVDDQRGCPTWAADLAGAALGVLETLGSGALAPNVLHAAGDTAVTWADFAEMIFAEQGRRGGAVATVRRITTAEYPTPARRPANSILSIDKLTSLTDWRPTPLGQAIRAVSEKVASMA
jgi:dTDP-4-dehydrorhamnose reductase